MVAGWAVARGRGQSGGVPQLFKIPLSGGTPVLLVKEYSTDPTWAPSGSFSSIQVRMWGRPFP